MPTSTPVLHDRGAAVFAASSGLAISALAILVASGLLAGGCTPPPPSAPPVTTTTAPPVESGVSWKAFDEGLAEAKATNRPVCLIFYTDWCPHCRNYHKVFEDPSVIAMSRKFVMIRLDKDKEPAISAKYRPDGDYIPRTYFLKPDGTLMPEITEQRAEFRYFYDESDPAAVRRSMTQVAGMKF